MKYRMRILMIMLIIFVFSCVISVTAVEFKGIQVIEEIVLSDSFSFSDSSECSGHDNFLQASVNENGWFAIYTRYTNVHENPNDVYILVYIDIYDEYGSFQREISFRTTHDLVMELTNSSLDMYFYDFVVCYDLATSSVKSYRIPKASAIDTGVYTSLRQAEFDVNGWHYSCKKDFHGYTSLTRTKGDISEELVSFSGTGVIIWNAAIAVVIVTAIAIVVIILTKKHSIQSRTGEDLCEP